MKTGRSAQVVGVEPGLDVSTFQAMVTEVKQSQGGQFKLTETDIIASGERGVKAPENFKRRPFMPVCLTAERFGDQPREMPSRNGRHGRLPHPALRRDGTMNQEGGNQFDWK